MKILIVEDEKELVDDLNEFLDDQYQEAEFKMNQLKGHTEALDELFKSWGEIFGTKKI